MRKPDSERIYVARRAAILSRLTGGGVGPARAEALVAEWEADSAARGVVRHTAAFWDEAWLWITVRRARR
jgi:hypothetical protein